MLTVHKKPALQGSWLVRSKPGEKVVDITIILFMAFVAFITLYPFWYCIIQSFNQGLDARMGGIYFWPRKFTLDNYANVFNTGRLPQACFITALRTVVGTFTSVLFTAMVAYGLTKQDLMFRKAYSIVAIITMYFGGGIIPYYFLLRQLGLLNNFLVFIIPNLFSYFNALLFIANFKSIPPSLFESARIDGAGEMTIFARIVLPVSAPILATIALFNGVGHWNAWFDAAIYTQDPALKTLQCLLWEIINYANNIEELSRKMNIPESSMTVEAVRYTTMVIAVVPITIVYPFLQRYFVKGMMIGAIKG